MTFFSADSTTVSPCLLVQGNKLQATIISRLDGHQHKEPSAHRFLLHGTRRPSLAPLPLERPIIKCSQATSPASREQAIDGLPLLNCTISSRSPPQHDVNAANFVPSCLFCPALSTVRCRETSREVLTHDKFLESQGGARIRPSIIVSMAQSPLSRLSVAQRPGLGVYMGTDG